MELWGFRKAQWSHGVSESTVESWGFRKVQCSHGVSVKYSGVTGFQESIVESRDFKKI